MPLPGFLAGFHWLEEHQHDVLSTSAAPVHWDFHPENILIKENDEAVVIDWTSLDLTDYRFDLGWTLLLITTYEGARWRNILLNEYERQAGHKVEGMAYFDAVSSFRRLISVVGSLLLGADRFGMRPGAEEIMRRQSAPLKRVYRQFQAITGQKIPEVENFLDDAGRNSLLRSISRRWAEWTGHLAADLRRKRQ
jgi:aminoglycoside phosphotransferase (APT) family kinase protein